MSSTGKHALDCGHAHIRIRLPGLRPPFRGLRDRGPDARPARPARAPTSQKLLSTPGMVGTAGRKETEAIPACRSQGGHCGCAHNSPSTSWQSERTNGELMATPIEQRGYAHPDVLVSTDWVEQHLNDPDGPHHRVERGHAALRVRPRARRGARGLDRRPERSDPPRLHHARGLRGADVDDRRDATDTTVVFYGDKNNWWACYAFWVFQLFGHTNAKVMDGGRLKWEKEKRATCARRAVLPADAVQGAGAQRRAAPRLSRRRAWRT